MPWTSVEFMKQLEACENRYEMEDSWYAKNKWGDQHKYSLNAWNLYRKASTNALGGILLLGDGKIRKDSLLMANFGIASVAGAWDPEEKALVKKLEAQRTAMRTAPGLRDAPAVQGQGSILSDANWTPLMNDCYILGGAHGGHEFFLALEDVEVMPPQRSLAQIFASLPSLDPKEKWRTFFNEQPGIFWGEKENAPRVLVRELIGLHACGYRVQLYSTLQLSFVATGPDNSTFTTYLDALVTAGYRSKKREVILNFLSLFFFQKPGMLRA
jgi:hypothetical protein